MKILTPNLVLESARRREGGRNSWGGGGGGDLSGNFFSEKALGGF